MMSKTHLSVGMATALAIAPTVTNIASVDDCTIALASGAIGGVLADVDILDNDYKHDALFGELAAFGILIVAIAIDFLTKGGLCEYVVSHKTMAIIGAVLFLVLWIYGFNCDHRKFTHSLLSMCLFSVAIALIYYPMALVFGFAYLSHLVLDILNKKKIQLLFPANGGICFGICYASKTGNAIFMILGFIATAALMAMRITNL